MPSKETAFIFINHKSHKGNYFKMNKILVQKSKSKNCFFSLLNYLKTFVTFVVLSITSIVPTHLSVSQCFYNPIGYSWIFLTNALNPLY